MIVDGEPIESMQDAMNKLLGPEKSVVELVVKKVVTGLMQEVSWPYSQGWIAASGR